MSVEETRARIKARIWQHLAQSDLSLPQVPREQLDKLVDLVADAALFEVDNDLATESAKLSPQADVVGDVADETVLWQGRPFLSLNELYVITSERVRVISGLFGKERVDIELVRIQDFDQTQTVRERMLNLGDLTVHSHDRSHPVVVLNNIADPQEVHEILRRAVLDARQRHRLTYREEM
jgi:hypothetical protein